MKPSATSTKGRKLQRGPQHAMVIGGDASKAWFYENKKSIDVYIYTTGTDARSCRIRRSAIVDWLERTK